MNSSSEYDVNVDAWQVYKKIYGNTIQIQEEKNIAGRPYVKGTFKFNGKESLVLKFSGETDFNFSNKKVFGYGMSRYDHFRKLLGTRCVEY